MTLFRYDPDILDRFPSLRAGAALLDHLRNGPTSPELARAFDAVQAEVVERLAGAAPSTLPSVQAWRRAFTAFGVDATKYRNAIEALLRRLQKTGSIPHLGTLVDLGNLVSIRHAVPLIIVDLDHVHGALTVRAATGDERFDDLGGTQAEHPAPGEVVFVDEAGEVAARRWCWRQSNASAVRDTTTRCLVVIEAQHAAARDDVDAALASFVELTETFLPGATITTAPLDAAHPSFP